MGFRGRVVRRTVAASAFAKAIRREFSILELKHLIGQSIKQNHLAAFAAGCLCGNENPNKL